MKFNTRLKNSIRKKNSLVCVGLDSRYDFLPEFVKKNSSVSQAILEFNKLIIEQTHDMAAAYKMNVAFYAGFGVEGLKGLELTNQYIKSNVSDSILLADCKRSEMGESVLMVKQEIFDWLQFDCVMCTPWFGQDTVAEYVKDEAKGVCIYVHDSNPSAPDFQGVLLKNGLYLYEYVAQQVSQIWNKNDNIFIEVGATYPKVLNKVRKIVGEDMVMLTAGIGPQGGKIADLKNIRGKSKQRLLVNSSRGIIFAGERTATKKEYCQSVRSAAIELQQQLNGL